MVDIKEEVKEYVPVDQKIFHVKYDPPAAPELEIGYSWVLWELYQNEEGVGALNYMDQMQKVACFNDVFSFW